MTNTATNQSDLASKAQHAVVVALEKILTPIARLALSHRIPFQVFTTVAKRAFVRVANDEFNIEGRSQTKSRVAMLTGISRADVNAVLWDPEHQKIPDLKKGSRPAAVVEAWRRDSVFLDGDGKPAPLRVRGDEGSFEALVRGYGSDVPPMTMLDELIRAGTVEHTPDGSVQLVEKMYIPAGPGSPEQIQILGSTAEQLLSTGIHNIHSDPEGQEPAYFQRRFWTAGLPPHKVEEFRDRLNELLNQQLNEASEVIEAAEERPVQEGYHVLAGVGYYYFEKS